MTNFRFISVLLSVTLLFSPFALAANLKFQWPVYLAVITTLSVLGAYVAVNRKQTFETKAMKFLTAGIYFWVITFIQFGVLAIVYSAMK